MSFFDELPPAPERKPQRGTSPEWMRIPYEVVPAAFPLAQLIHRGDTVALVLSGVRVWPNGLTITLVATLHPEADSPKFPLPEAMFGRPTGGVRGGLRVGLLHADGTRMTYPQRGDSDDGRTAPPAAAITSRGGGGSTDYASTELYLWPLPAAGDLELVFQWRDAGLEEERITVDGDVLRAAAAGCEEIWPGAKVPPHEPGEGWLAYGPG